MTIPALANASTSQDLTRVPSGFSGSHRIMDRSTSIGTTRPPAPRPAAAAPRPDPEPTTGPPRSTIASNGPPGAGSWMSPSTNRTCACRGGKPARTPLAWHPVPAPNTVFQRADDVGIPRYRTGVERRVPLLLGRAQSGVQRTNVHGNTLPLGSLNPVGDDRHAAGRTGDRRSQAARRDRELRQRRGPARLAADPAHAFSRDCCLAAGEKIVATSRRVALRSLPPGSAGHWTMACPAPRRWPSLPRGCRCSALERAGMTRAGPEAAAVSASAGACMVRRRSGHWPNHARVN